jgi:hypothetical protein
MGARGELLEREKDGWFKGVDCIVSSFLLNFDLDFVLDYFLVILLLIFWVQSDNYWLNTRTPALRNIKRRRKYSYINTNALKNLARSTRNSTTASRTWLNTRTPALTYGLRGLVYLKLTVSGPGRDLHSGVCRLSSLLFPRTYSITSLIYAISSSYIFTYLTRSPGVFGRTVHEPMTDLISLMSRLIDPAGNIPVPGVDDMGQAAAVEEQ